MHSSLSPSSIVTQKFANADFDGDGELSREDMVNSAKRDGRDPDSSAREIKFLFNKGDVNKDGRISFVRADFFTMRIRPSFICPHV